MLETALNVNCIFIIIEAISKKKLLVQDLGGAKFQPAGIHRYVEDLKRGPNTEIGPKDIFERASI